MKVRTSLVTAGLVLGVVMAAGCSLGGGPSSDSGDTKADKTENSGGDAAGSRDNPFAAGDKIKYDEWTIVVDKTNTDATKAVLDENEFNEIDDGNVAVMVHLDATYTGKNSATAWVELDAKVVAKDGTTHDANCGVIPDDLTEASEVYTDATAKGNVCVQMPKDKVSGAVWRIGAGFLDDDQGFVAFK